MTRIRQLIEAAARRQFLADAVEAGAYYAHLRHPSLSPMEALAREAGLDPPREATAGRWLIEHGDALASCIARLIEEGTPPDEQADPEPPKRKRSRRRTASPA